MTPRRAAITAFYAFCREVDDVADEMTDPGVAATKLAWWRSEVASAFAGSPSHPAMHALLPHAATYGIEPQHLLAVIDGCQMDLEQSRYLDFANLARYCDLVAGVVGEVAANIFGRTLAATVDYAHRLGLAMQLTNIVRDVGDDARRNRIYLPMSELKQFDVKAAELLERRMSSSAGRTRPSAHRTYDEALALLGDADQAARSRPDDGQHLPHAAARDRDEHFGCCTSGSR
jgi:phytoene synthase